MIERPAFREDVCVSVLPGEGVVITSEGSLQLLHGQVNQALAETLDGRRSADEVVDVLADRLDRAHVYFGLMKLEEGGFICEAGSHDYFPRPARAHDADVKAGSSLQARRLQVATFGEVPLGDSLRELGHMGVEVGLQEEVVLALTDDYLRPDLASHNETSLAAGRSWLLLRPVGHVLWIGPWFRPGDGPCWQCLAQRLRSNRPVGEFLARRAGLDRPVTAPAVWTSDSLRLGLHRGICYLDRALAGETLDTVITIDLDTDQERRHPVVRRPQCPACGDEGLLAKRVGSPIRLRSRFKKYTMDGGHRVKLASETVTVFSKHVGPVTGVVPEIRPLSIPGSEAPDDDLLPVHLFAAGGNAADPGADLELFRKHLRSWSGGKGMTEQQARASALGEALERYSGIFQGDEPRLRTTMHELGDDAVDPDRCTLYSEAQYRNREIWNAPRSPFRFVPIRFDPSQPVDWTPVWSLTEARRRYLPTMYLYYQYPCPRGESFCRADSNGAAAGNTMEEAILQGTLEVVERDAVAIWWYNRVPRPGVDLDSLDVPYWRSLSERYRRMGRELWVLDLTSDLGIPVFAGITRKVSGREEILMGLGAHLDPMIAVSRALTEVNQMLVSRAGVDPAALDPAMRTWLLEATIENQPYLSPSKEEATDLSLCPSVCSDDIKEDVETCRARVESRGLELLVLDQTRPDIDVSVVKVIVPEMRFFRPRFAPGRLFDVAPELGWCQTRRAEEQLNPVAFFL